jgi:hypothetical protein
VHHAHDHVREDRENVQQIVADSTGAVAADDRQHPTRAYQRRQPRKSGPQRHVVEAGHRRYHVVAVGIERHQRTKQIAELAPAIGRLPAALRVVDHLRPNNGDSRVREDHPRDERPGYFCDAHPSRT